MSIVLNNSRILITGGSGFIGNHLKNELKKYTEYVFCTGRDFVLEKNANADYIIRSIKPDYIFHLAGYNGGIQFNLKNPADIFYRNTVMGLNVLQSAMQNNVKKVLSLVASCAYPEYEWVNQSYIGYFQENREIMKENKFLESPPHNSVSCHGYAKRNLQLAATYFNKQYGLNSVCVCPSTVYGPGDSFNINRTKVVGGMVKRFVDAVDSKLEIVECWGSGKPLREIVYVKDVVNLTVNSMLYYNDSSEPLNISGGQELSIKDIAELTANKAGYKGKITWDTSKPDGQYRKRLCLDKMNHILPSYNFTDFEDGIEETIKDYRQRKKNEFETSNSTT